MRDSASSQRIAFLDVDGTVADARGVIAPSTVRAVHEARANGRIVYLSTGRSANDIPPAVRDMGFDGAITNNGAYARHGERTLLARPLARADAQRLTEWFDLNDLPYYVQTDKGVFATARMRDLATDYRGHHSVGPNAETAFGKIADVDLAQVATAVFVGFSSDAVSRASYALADGFQVTPGSIRLSGVSIGEVTARGVTKGVAVSTVLSNLGFDIGQAIGIGDGWNDIEMFDACGVSIAMAGADDAVKRRADEVTTGVLDDGIWNAFLNHGLISHRDRAFAAAVAPHGS